MPSGFDFEHQDFEQPDWISTEVEFESNTEIEVPFIQPLKVEEPLLKKEINIIINEQQSRNTTTRRGGLF